MQLAVRAAGPHSRSARRSNGGLRRRPVCSDSQPRLSASAGGDARPAVDRLRAVVRAARRALCLCHGGRGHVALLLSSDAIIRYFDYSIHAEQSQDAVAAGVALRASGVGPTDACFRGCENTARSGLTAVPVYIPDGSCAGAVACSQPPAAGLSKHRLARVSLVVSQANQRRVGLNANSTSGCRLTVGIVAW